MIPFIENYDNPQIGDFFMVRTVEFSRNNYVFEWPVFSESHTDEGVQDSEHYHIDWRFMEEKVIKELRDGYKKLYPGGWGNVVETENYSPIMKYEMIKETFKSWKYLRDFVFPNDYEFWVIRKKMLDCGAKMKKMKCPHHGTSLVSCKPVNGVVTCPQHGLKWNTLTGELI